MDLTSITRQLENIEDNYGPVESGRAVPPPLISVGRLADAYATTPPGAGSFDRVFTLLELHDEGVAAGKISVDTSFERLSTPQLDHDAALMTWSHNVAVMEFGQHLVIVPSPQKMIFVRDDSAGGSFPGGRLGTYVDVDGAGALSPFRAARPIAFMQPAAQFVDGGSFPTKVGNIYPGVHVWPFPGVAVPGVDAALGFFCCALQAPGTSIAPLVKEATYDPADGPRKFRFEFDRDAQGNLLGVTFTIVAP